MCFHLKEIDVSLVAQMAMLETFPTENSPVLVTVPLRF